MSVATVNTKEKISCKTEFQAFDHLMKSVKNDADILCCLLQHLWTYTGRHFYMPKYKKIKIFEGIFCTSEIYRIENVPLQGFNMNCNACLRYLKRRNCMIATSHGTMQFLCLRYLVCLLISRSKILGSKIL